MKFLPQILLRNGSLKDVVESHNMREIDEHGGGFIGLHSRNLRLIVGIPRIRVQSEAVCVKLKGQFAK